MRWLGVVGAKRSRERGKERRRNEEEEIFFVKNI